MSINLTHVLFHVLKKYTLYYYGKRFLNTMLLQWMQFLFYEAFVCGKDNILPTIQTGLMTAIHVLVLMVKCAVLECGVV